MNADALNLAVHIALFATLTLHPMLYLDFRPNRLRVFACVATVFTAYTGYMALFGGGNAVIGKPLGTILSTVATGLFSARFIHTGGFRRVFFVICSCVSYMQALFILIYMLMVEVLDFPADAATFLRGRVIYCVVTLASFPLLRRYLRPRILRLLDAVDGQRTAVVIALMACLYLLGHSTVSLFFYHPDSPVATTACLSMILCIVVFYYTLYSFVVAESANQRLKSRAEAAERLAGTYSFYDGELKRKEETIRSLRHDFRHMVLHLGSLLREKDYAGVAKRLEDIAGATIEMKPTPYCENMTVNTLVTFHFAQAEEKGIACTAKLYVPEALDVPAAELAAILGNALENSVKGAETMGDVGYISIAAKPAKDCVSIDLENNYLPGAYRKGSGVGLSSIRTLCEKNRGCAEATDAEGTFRLNILLRLG